MFKNKLNRKFKRILALSTLGAICCSQNLVVNAGRGPIYTSAIIKRILDCPNQTLKDLYENVNLWQTNDLKKRLKDINGNEFDYQFNRLDKKSSINVGIVAFSYSDDVITEPIQLIILRNDQDPLNRRYYPLPYDTASNLRNLPELLVKGFQLLKNTNYDLDKIETLKGLFESETEREEFLSFLEGKLKAKKEETTITKNKSFLDQASAEIGISKPMLIGIGLGTAALGAGLVFYAVKTTGNTLVGVAQGLGGSAAPTPLFAPVAPAAPPVTIINNTPANASPAPTPIVINNNNK